MAGLNTNGGDIPGPQRRRAIRLAAVLAQVRFPAHRWELVACALSDGWDVVSLREMEGLPAGVYPSFHHVLRALAKQDAVGAKSPRSQAP